MAKRKYGLWLLNAVLVAAAVYGGAKWYAQHRMVETLERLAEELRPNVSLSYGEIETDLIASVAHIHQVELRPAQGPSPFIADRVTFSGPGIMRTLFKNPFGGSDRQDIPTNLSLLIEGIHPPMAALLAQAASVPTVSSAAGSTENQDANSDLPSADPAAARACRPNGAFTLELLDALGVSDPVLDGEMRWHVDDVDQELEMGMRFAVREVQSFDLEMRLGGINSESLKSRNLSTPPELKAFDIGWRLEPEIAKRYLAECSARLGLDSNEFRSQLVARFIAALESQGLDLGPGMQMAVKQFYDEWGEVRLSAHPSEPVGLLSLAFVPPAQLARRLGARLDINQQTYADLDFNFTPPPSVAQGPGAASMFDSGVLGALLGGSSARPKSAESGEQATYPEPARVDYRYRWQRIPLARLERHLDRMARVYLDNGRMREGQLMRVDEGLVVVEQRLHGGKFTVPVPRERVDHVEVRLREAVVPEPKSEPGAASTSQ